MIDEDAYQNALKDPDNLPLDNISIYNNIEEMKFFRLRSLPGETVFDKIAYLK